MIAALQVDDFITEMIWNQRRMVNGLKLWGEDVGLLPFPIEGMDVS